MRPSHRLPVPRDASQCHLGTTRPAKWWHLASLTMLLMMTDSIRAETPALVVVISVDQWCYDYLNRFSSGLSNQGLTRRCESDGIWFENCLHQHAYTFTGPGHAVLLTGSYPARNGIVDNDWYDRTKKSRVYCVLDESTQIVGTTRDEKPASPATLAVDTVGDQLKLATNRRSKVFGVSIKDRASILMAGHMADAAYWMSYDGNWVTTSYYQATLPGYLRNLNEQGTVFRFAGASWERLLPPQQYRHGTVEQSRHERPRFGMGPDFPHVMPTTHDETYIRQLVCSPFGNDVTFEVAQQVIVHEQLGRDEFPDLLTVNLSSPDYIGHSFGPHSLEVEDCTYRTDLQLGDFVRFLESTLKDRAWLVILASDHGVAPIPELAAEWKIPAKRNPLGQPDEKSGDIASLHAQLEAHLRTQLHVEESAPPLVEYFSKSEVYLVLDHPALQGERAATARQITRDWLLRIPSVSFAATREELLQSTSGRDDAASNDLLQLMRRSYFPQRSGDVQYVLRPYYVASDAGTTHGTPWHYDRHIPLMMVGSPSVGLPTLRIKQEVSPASIAATIAELVHIEPPSGCEERPLPMRSK